jgi:hypothetical protein
MIHLLVTIIRNCLEISGLIVAERDGPQIRFHLRSVLIMPVWRASLLLSNRNWSTIASTRLGRKQGKTSLNTFKYSITLSEDTRRWAIQAQKILKLIPSIRWLPSLFSTSTKKGQTLLLCWNTKVE